MANHLEERLKEAYDSLPYNAGTLVPQVYFHERRDWRLDWSLPDILLGIEIQGGTWIMGRHSRAYGMSEDYTKHNEAMRLGWRMVYATSDMLHPTKIHLILDLIIDLANQPINPNIPARNFWIPVVRGLQIGQWVEKNGYLIERPSSSIYKVNGIPIDERTVREAQYYTLNALTGVVDPLDAIDMEWKSRQ